MYSTNADTADWQLSFSNVGTGKGDYVQSDFTPNGRVFKWVAPDTVNNVIVHKGDHLPLKALVAPKTKQLVTLGVEQRFATASKATAEIAFSNYDQNTFSDVGDDNDQGLAVMVGAEHSIPLGASDADIECRCGVERRSIGTRVQRGRALSACGVRTQLECLDHIPRWRPIARWCERRNGARSLANGVTASARSKCATGSRGVKHDLLADRIPVVGVSRARVAG
ncbi:MAG: hypothetical protein IPH53_22895 [Flavobacteriales bacterium]|nr:hypothetical protein [Flavobacteriales bacterium]